METNLTQSKLIHNHLVHMSLMRMHTNYKGIWAQIYAKLGYFQRKFMKIQALKTFDLLHKKIKSCRVLLNDLSE